MQTKPSSYVLAIILAHTPFKSSRPMARLERKQRKRSTKRVSGGSVGPRSGGKHRLHLLPHR